jgi:hypothetical protein
MQAIREASRIGVTPRRKGSEFNKREFEMLVLDKVMNMLDPTRPRALDGSMLSDRQAIDVRRATIFESHPEMMVRLFVALRYNSGRSWGCLTSPLHINISLSTCKCP